MSKSNLEHYLEYPAPTQTNLFLDSVESEVLGSIREVKTALDDLGDFPTKTNYQKYVDEARFSPEWKTAEWNGFTLPGQGGHNAYCGKWVSWGCNNVDLHPKKKHYCEHSQKTCKRAKCDICLESWILRNANRATRRLWKFSKKTKLKFKHVVLSPPRFDMSYEDLNKWLKQVLKEANITTHAIIFHPFRFDQSKMRPYASPHFHILTTNHITATKKFYPKTKWFIKNLGELKKESDIFNCIKYLNSHCGIKPKTHSIRYFGDISYSKLKIEKEPKTHVCPYCYLPLRIFFIKKDHKHKPPPLDHVGLWEKECFELVDIVDNDTKIPFYSMNDDGTDYHEELIYSFEEQLIQKMRSPKINQFMQDMRDLRFKTSINSKKLDEYCELGSAKNAK